MTDFVSFARLSRRLLGRIALGCLLLLTACRPDQGPTVPQISELRKDESLREARPRLIVVATYSILGDWTRIVGGDDVEVVTMVGPGGDAHTYEPTPADSVNLSRAQLIVENGLGFETWLDRLCLAAGTSAQRVVVTRRVEARRVGGGMEAVEWDPHVWHSPRLAMVMVSEIAEALSNADPSRASDFRRRAAEYEIQLEELHEWIGEQISTIPPSRRRLVTTHDTFGYFARDYGFEVLSILGSVTSESSDPSAAQIAECVDRIRATRVPAVFAENILGPRLTQQVASEAGVTLVGTLYTDALGEPGTAGETYLGMMRANVLSITEALR